MHADFEALNDKVVDMNCRIDELNSLKSHVDNQIGEVEQRMNNTWADVVKGEVKKSVDVLAEEVKISNSELNKTVYKIKGDVDSINRDCNIVLFRMKESLEKNVDDAFKRDKTTIFNVLSSITNGELKENDIKRVYHLGRNKDTTRPLLIELRDESIKNLIMENRRNMVKLDDDLKNLAISHDFTRDQRELCKKLVDEAKERQKQESGEFIYRVRGEPTSLRVVRIKRKVSNA